MFDEWVRVSEAAALGSPDKAYALFLSQLQQLGLLKGEDGAERFFRVLTVRPWPHPPWLMQPSCFTHSDCCNPSGSPGLAHKCCLLWLPHEQGLPKGGRGCRVERLFCSCTKGLTHPDMPVVHHWMRLNLELAEPSA